jgi:hypothetical protein
MPLGAWDNPILNDGRAALAHVELRAIFGICPSRSLTSRLALLESLAKRGAEGSTRASPASGPPFLDVHPAAFKPHALPGYAWLQLPDRIREVHRQCLEFWYDPPGCALTDEELELLRTIAAANVPVMFQAEGRTVPAHLAFDHRVDVLRNLRKAGWIVLEVWVAEPGNCGHARRRYSAAQAYCTESGREALDLIGG